MVLPLSLQAIRNKGYNFMGSASPYGSFNKDEVKTDTLEKLPQTQAAMKILTEEEFDINTHFEPKKRKQENFADKLTSTEFYTLAALCFIAPSVFAYFGTRVFVNHSAKKAKINAMTQARRLFQVASGLNPTYMRSIIPPIPTGNDINKSQPLKTNTAAINASLSPSFFLDASAESTAQISAALSRYEKLTDDEIRFFILLYNNWCHNDQYNETVTRHLEWVLTNKFVPNDAAKGHYPFTAVKEHSDSLPAEIVNYNEFLSSVRAASTYELDPSRVSPTRIQAMVDRFVKDTK